MNDVVLGALLLYLLGLASCAAAVRAWRRRAAVTVAHAVVGALALGEAAVTVVDEPARTVSWSAGAVLVLLVGVAQLLGHRRSIRSGTPAPPSDGAYTSLTSTPT